MGRLLVISDIHGCLIELEELIKKVNLSRQDTIVFLGDNVDRGPNSVGVVFKIRELKEQGYDVITIKGNHEEMLMYCISKYSTKEEVFASSDFNVILNNGTLSTLIEYYSLNRVDKLNFMNELNSYGNYYIDGPYLLVHAGISPNIPMASQVEGDLRWIREGFIDQDYHGLPYTVIFGHTPTRYLNTSEEFKIWYNNDKIGIDCGCVFGGKLACLDVFNNIEYYVNGYVKC